VPLNFVLLFLYAEEAAKIREAKRKSLWEG
jgi:hypothetical protein